jgi:hypothetical protein
MKTKFFLDRNGDITSEKWCCEEGQWIVKIIGNSEDFSSEQLSNMGITHNITL